jgi:hypothetical protein
VLPRTTPALAARLYVAVAVAVVSGLPGPAGALTATVGTAAVVAFEVLKVPVLVPIAYDTTPRYAVALPPEPPPVALMVIAGGAVYPEPAVVTPIVFKPMRMVPEAPEPVPVNVTPVGTVL